MAEDESDARARAAQLLPDRLPPVLSGADVYAGHPQAAALQRADDRAQRMVVAKRSDHRRSILATVLLVVVIVASCLGARALISGWQTAGDTPAAWTPVAPAEVFSVGTPAFRLLTPI